MSTLILGFMAAVVVLAGYALAHAWRRAMRASGPLPLHGMIRRLGLTPGEAGEGLGVDTLAFAARRCAFCDLADECRHRLQTAEPLPADCPNAELFARVSRPAA